MRNAPTLVLIIWIAASLAGCAASGKAKIPTPAPIVNRPAAAAVPPPPPPPLSTPQTQVDLPRPQAVSEAALSPDTLPAVVEVVEPAPKSVPQPPRNRTQQPAATSPAAGPPAAAPTEPSSPQFGEIIPEAQIKRLKEEAQSRRRETQQILDQLGRRPQLNTAQQRVVTDIKSFITSSQEAEARGDMKLASALAENARILAKDLTNAK